MPSDTLCAECARTGLLMFGPLLWHGTSLCGRHLLRVAGPAAGLTLKDAEARLFACQEKRIGEADEDERPGLWAYMVEKDDALAEVDPTWSRWKRARELAARAPVQRRSPNARPDDRPPPTSS